MNRREALGAIGTATLLAGERTLAEGSKGGSSDAGASAVGQGSAFAGQHALKPLPFNPAKLAGLSEKLLRSHHENNYGGALKNLNKVETELARVTRDTPGYLVAGLKERELTFRNSVILHELYFGNLGGDGKPGGSVVQALAQSHGSFARWEEHFRALGGSLAGGSGWAILEYDVTAASPRAYWSGHHTQSLAFGIPLLVMDMYEHAYALDYGAAAPKYLDAFFQNIAWDVVEGRFVQALKVAALLKA